MTERALVGAWRLRSLELRTDRETLRPFGDHPVGLLIYSLDGHMCSTLTSEGRVKFQVDDLLEGRLEERAAAAASCVAYAGTYRVHGDRVTHRIEVSLFPNWVGQEQDRIFERVGDRLVLSTPPMLLRAESRRAVLTWERASP